MLLALRFKPSRFFLKGIKILHFDTDTWSNVNNNNNINTEDL